MHTYIVIIRITPSGVEKIGARYHAVHMGRQFYDLPVPLAGGFQGDIQLLCGPVYKQTHCADVALPGRPDLEPIRTGVAYHSIIIICLACQYDVSFAVDIEGDPLTYICNQVAGVFISQQRAIVFDEGWYPEMLFDEISAFKPYSDKGIVEGWRLKAVRRLREPIGGGQQGVHIVYLVLVVPAASPIEGESKLGKQHKCGVAHHPHGVDHKVGIAGIELLVPHQLAIGRELGDDGATVAVCREWQYACIVVPSRVAYELAENIDVALAVYSRAEYLVGSGPVLVIGAEVGFHPVEVLGVGGGCHHQHSHCKDGEGFDDVVCHIGCVFDNGYYCLR